MRIAICDDQLAQLQLLQDQCRRWGISRSVPGQVQTFETAEAFLFTYETDKAFDVLLLDIQMPGLSGMELARRLRTAGDSLTLALITAIPDYALEGYSVDALAYLLKPVSDKALYDLLDKVNKRSPTPFILVDHDGITERVPLSSILYLESQGHDTHIVCEGRTLISPHGLSHYAQQLGPNFHQIHRCYLINLAHAASIHRKEVHLDNDAALPVARGRFESLSQAYLAYYRSTL